MKNLKNIKEFCEEIENYRISLNPYEMEIIRDALLTYEVALKKDIMNYEWMQTESAENELKTTQRLYSELNNIPF